MAIARATGQRAEAYHLKAAGEKNWPKMAQAIERINAARAEGLQVSADMYTYTAGATMLAACLPPWVQAGGQDAMIARLKDPATRKRVTAEMRDPKVGWENLRLLAGSDERVLLLGFKRDALKPLSGKTLAQIARERGRSAEDTVMDLIYRGRLAGQCRVLPDERGERAARPEATVGEPGLGCGILRPEGVFLKSISHPRAYGNVARFLDHYVRDRKLMPLQEGIHRLTGLPAANWKLRDRGCLAVGCLADVVVFDPATINDLATYESRSSTRPASARSSSTACRSCAMASTPVPSRAGWCAVPAGRAGAEIVFQIS